MKKVIICIAILAVSFLNFASAQQIIPADSAKNYIGQTITVSGEVDDVYKGEKVINLNIGGKYPDQVFTATIFAKSFDAFKNLDKYMGKNVEVSGLVSEYKGKPQIIMTSEDQIKIVKKKK